MTWTIYFKGKTEPVHVAADYIDYDGSDCWVKLMELTNCDKSRTVGIFNSTEILAIVRSW